MLSGKEITNQTKAAAIELRQGALHDSLYRRTRIEQLSKEEAAIELKALATEIAYHQKDAPELTDAEYDPLVMRNKNIEEKFPDLVHKDSHILWVGALSSRAPLKKSNISTYHL